MSDEPRVERYNGIPHLYWHGDYVPLQHIGAALGEMVLKREAEIERLRESERLALQGCDTASDAFEEQLVENNSLREQLSKNAGELAECRRLLGEVVTNYEIAHHAIMERGHVDADFVDVTLRRRWYDAARKAEGGE